MIVRAPAHADDICPKCGSFTEKPTCAIVWRVADAKGLAFDCTNCGHVWRDVPDRAAVVRDLR